MRRKLEGQSCLGVGLGTWACVGPSLPSLAPHLVPCVQGWSAKSLPSACTSDALSALTCSKAAGRRGHGWVGWGQACRPVCGRLPTHPDAPVPRRSRHLSFLGGPGNPFLGAVVLGTKELGH